MLYCGILEKTPLGRIFIVSDEQCIVKIDFDKPDTREIDVYLTKWFGSPEITPGITSAISQAMIQLSGYFDGTVRGFDLPVRLFGTAFQQRCWAELCRIPYGETISYKTLAERVGSPKAFRAVGQANHHNPMNIVVPCHRVLAGDGSLGGYGSGLDIKQALLEHEAEHK